MFYQQKRYPANGLLFILSLLAAFFLGRKSEQYGYTIISRGCGCNTDVDNELDMMNDSNISTPNYPQ